MTLHSNAEQISKISKLIEEKGIRPSPQRTMIYDYLYTHHTHPTVDMIYTELSPLYSTLSKTTVYNTLKLFAEKNLVQVVKIEDDELRYDVETKPHIHFKCIECNKIFDIFADDQIQNLNKSCESLLPTGFSGISIQTCIWGRCADCESQKKVYN